MDTSYTSEILPQLLQRARAGTKRNAPFADNFSAIQQELRLRRRQLLGAYVSVRTLVLSDSGINDASVHALSQYLAVRTVFYWNRQDDRAEAFCYRFYRLSMYALAGGKISGERIDDILQLAECMVCSRKVFTIAMKDMLPRDMIGELFDFNETYDEHYCNPYFQDAVLASLCVFMGALVDPLNPPKNKEE